MSNILGDSATGNRLNWPILKDVQDRNVLGRNIMGSHSLGRNVMGSAVLGRNVMGSNALGHNVRRCFESSMADTEGGGGGCNPPPNCHKRGVTSVAVVISTVSTVSDVAGQA